MTTRLHNVDEVEHPPVAHVEAHMEAGSLLLHWLRRQVGRVDGQSLVHRRIDELVAELLKPSTGKPVITTRLRTS
jgi:hypothetical protein